MSRRDERNGKERETEDPETALIILDRQDKNLGRLETLIAHGPESPSHAQEFYCAPTTRAGPLGAERAKRQAWSNPGNEFAF